MGRRTGQWLALAAHVGALAPLAALAWMAWTNALGPVPIAAVTRLLGRYALALLLLSLVPTALRIVTGVSALTPFRRTLGLYSFLYASLHVLAFIGLDYRFQLGLVATVIGESRRELVGGAAFLILALLALTSVQGLMRRLGKDWRRLHRSVYLAGLLVVLHYLLNYKELRIGPLTAGAVLLLLLAIRFPPFARLLKRVRRREDNVTED